MNIGDTVEYNDLFREKKSGVITEIFSDMDSYDDMRLETAFRCTTPRSFLAMFL